MNPVHLGAVNNKNVGRLLFMFEIKKYLGENLVCFRINGTSSSSRNFEVTSKHTSKQTFIEFLDDVDK